MIVTRVYLVFITQDGDDARADAYFRELDEAADHHAEWGAVSRQPMAGDQTVFTVAAAGSQCVVEWLAEAPSPLPGGIRSAHLEHGDGFVYQDVRFLVYVEPADLAPGASEMPRNAEAICAIEALETEARGDALSRFVRLPYVAAAIHGEYVRQTGFVQYRNGRVPRVQTVEWVRRDDGAPLLRAVVGVYSIFSGEWSGPHVTVEQPVGPRDLDMILDCAGRLRDIPAG